MGIKQSSISKGLPIVNARAAGIDVGARFHVVAVSPELAAEPIQTFEAFTGDLNRMAQWLKATGVETVVMESTGVYWVAVYEILEDHGLNVVLANAREVKSVPGRKSDVNDAQWLQRLHACGLLRGSFRPGQNIKALRVYLRHRERLSDYRAAHIQHMQKALVLMNIQLHHVVSSLTGVTGMKIVRAICAGERDPQVLATFKDVRCKASDETIEAALIGNYQPEHLFTLAQALSIYDFYQAQIDQCDQQIEDCLKLLNLDREEPMEPLPKAKHRTKQPNDISFNVRQSLYQLVGTDLTQINGVGPYLAIRFISECGTDMSKWPSSKHFTSWLGLSPGCKISGGKVLSAHSRKTNNKLSVHLRLAAVTVGRSSTALGAFYRRLASRIGKAKAVTATARKIAVLLYNSMKFGIKYKDPGESYYETQYRERVIKNLHRRASEFGLCLSPIERVS